MHLARPWNPQGTRLAGIAVPSGWAVIGNGSRSKDAKECSEGAQAKPVAAASGKGAVSWAPPSGTTFPCKIDVHFAITFEDSSTAYRVDADGVAVEGCTD